MSKISFSFSGIMGTCRTYIVHLVQVHIAGEDQQQINCHYIFSLRVPSYVSKELQGSLGRTVWKQQQWYLGLWAGPRPPKELPALLQLVPTSFIPLAGRFAGAPPLQLYSRDSQSRRGTHWSRARLAGIVSSGVLWVAGGSLTSSLASVGGRRGSEPRYFFLPQEMNCYTVGIKPCEQMQNNSP